MALNYVSTCAGGDHHLFQDDRTNERLVIDQGMLKAEYQRRAEWDAIIAQLPQAKREDIFRREAVSVEEKL